MRLRSSQPAKYILQEAYSLPSLPLPLGKVCRVVGIHAYCQYHNTQMKMKSVYRVAKAIVISADAADADFRRQVNSKCEWSNPEDVAFYKREDRRKKRRRILDELVGKERRCPCCRECILDPKGWMVRLDGRIALCRSCYSRHRPATEPIIAKGIFNVVTRYEVNGKELKRIRIAAGLSLAAMGRAVGVQASRIFQIEEREGTIKEEQAILIMRVLEEAGVKFIE